MLLLLFAFVAPILINGCKFLVLFFLAKKKGSDILKNKGWLSPLIDLGISIVLEIAFFLTVYYGFGGVYFGNVAIAMFLLSLLIAALSPFSIYKKIKDKSILDKENLRGLIFKSSLLAIFLLETLAFNNDAYGSKGEVTEISFSSSLVSMPSSSTIHEQEDGSVGFEYGNKTYFTVTMDAPSNIDTVSMNIVTKEDMKFAVTVDTYMGKEKVGHAYNGDIATGYDPSNLIRLNGATFDSMKILLGPAWGRQYIGDRVNEPYMIRCNGIRLNTSVKFYFSYIRFFLFAFLAGVACYIDKVIREKGEERADVTRKFQLGILALGVVTFIGCLIYLFVNKVTFFNAYPLNQPVESYDIFTQTFDAFRKGRLSLDIKTTKLLWDHAYYNGNVYSYYGPLPIFLVSFPLYWLSGGHLLLSAQGLEIVGLSLLIPMFLVLLCELIHIYDKNMDWRSLSFILFASFFFILGLQLVSYKQYLMGGSVLNPCVEAIYHVPDIYGLLNMDAFLFVALLGYQKRKQRPWLFSLAGLFFVFIIASRPNLALCILFAAPLFLKPLFRKGEWKSKALEYLPMFGILLFGAALICLYNLKRFDSLTEFGARYQHTVADESNMKLHGNQIIPGLLHFFCNPWLKNSKVFPYISYSNVNFTADKTDFSYYLSGAVGAFTIPFFCLPILSPLAFKKGQDHWLYAFMLLLLPTTAALAVLTYSYAGLCPRYMLEIFHLCTIASIVAMVALIKRFAKISNYLIPIATITILFSLYIVINLNFMSFDGLNAGDVGGLLLRFRDAFAIFNA